jgi:hypothetical protein
MVIQREVNSKGLLNNFVVVGGAELRNYGAS